MTVSLYNPSTGSRWTGTGSYSVVYVALYGGGVYVYSVKPATFTKTGGVICGDTDNTHTPGSDENTATAGYTNGHAVYYHFNSDYYRNATLNAGNDISTEDTSTGWNQ